MKAFRYLFSCYPAVLVIAGNLLGGWWTVLNIINITVVMVLVELLFSKENREPVNVSSSYADLVLYIQASLHTIVIGSLIYGVANGLVEGYFIFAAAISTGMFAGQNGIVNAHELIHRKSPVQQLLGIWSLIIVNYGHFYVEHIRGHHKNVGTVLDPATARLGENIYSFIARTIPQQFYSAWKLERERLANNGKSFFNFSNVVLSSIFVQLLICISVGLFFGVNALVAYLVCSAMSIVLLEYVNYIEHYGLVRTNNERVTGKHSWQSDITFSRFTLIELSRHADHHYMASKPYQTLVSHDNSPVLPGGYFSIFYRVMIPPLWFKTVHPLIRSSQQNDL